MSELGAVWNGLALAMLLTALYVLRFRGWTRPGRVVLYFLFFVVLETIATRYLIPPGAFGPTLGILCAALTLPVLVAAFLVWRHERRHDEQS